MFQTNEIFNCPALATPQTFTQLQYDSDKFFPWKKYTSMYKNKDGG
jgi:alpha-N-acetylglucosamine transferase